MRRPPPGACDAHCHVIGPHSRFPLVPGAGDIRSDSCAGHLRQLDDLGLSRAVIVHPSSVYGDRREALLDALAQGNARYRGVAVAHADVDDATLESWRVAGVRALRFVTVKDAQGRPFAGSAGFNDFFALAPRMRTLGWHAQFWGDCADIVSRERDLTRSGVPIVLDHMGKIEVGAGADGRDFLRLCSLVREGAIWVKLTLCRNSRHTPDYADLRPFHDALVAANPDRLLWGSDWPHLRMGDAAPDAAHLLRLFSSWIGDEGIEARILADNPQSLFGFPPLGDT
jgi:2-pyrone-4,6-dicarboxylate lactonase